MAIVMTKKGELPSERKFTGRCGTCKSEFEAKQGDLEYEADYHSSCYKAPCTLCNSVVYFKQVL